MRVIDSISEWTGRFISWLCLALIAIVVLEVVMRYVFNNSQNWSPELSGMLLATITAMGWAYVHRHSGHVRVDIIYNFLSPRGKAVLNVICALTMFFPLMFVLIRAAASWMYYAFSRHEVLIATSWYPPAAPSRTMVLIALSLFALQGIAWFFRDCYFLIRNKTL